MRKYLLPLIYIILFSGILYALSQVFIVREVVSSIDELKESEIFKLEELQELQQDRDNLQLALAGIDIVQGDNGKIEWALNATWANYSAENADLTVHKPYITVYNDNASHDDITAKGDTGRLIEDNTKLLLAGNVVLTQDTFVINTPLLEYNTENEIFTFPQKANISSPSMQGSADVITWDTTKNNIQAQKNVVFIFNDDNNKFLK